MSRQNLSSDVKWEEIVGYSRAVKVGNIIEVAGTTATEGDEIIYPFNAYEQTGYILLKIQEALESLGASMKDVVRTRIFVTDITRWEEVGKAHAEFFKDIRPACTLVEVFNLIDDRLVVEIEATAIIG